MNYRQNLIFVYGTLLSGTDSRMHQWLAARADFVGPGSFRGRLISLGHYPGLISSRRPADQVYGEIYRLLEPVKTLVQLDAYEEYDASRPSKCEYIRVMRRVRCSNGRNLSCWIYLYNREGKRKPLIPSGDFLSVPGLVSGIRLMESSDRGQWSSVSTLEAKL